MIFFLMFIGFIIAANAKILSKDNFHEEYLSIENTKNVKGLFVILVLFSHYVQYVTLDSVWDKPYLELRSHLDQMVVVPFLFYSGYGIMKSIQKKGISYVKSIIQKRLPKVWFEFCVAVLLFWIVDLALGKVYPIKRVLLSLTGWESIGNSNWYILGMLILYVLTYFSFVFLKENCTKRDEVFGCLLLTVFTIAVVCVFIKAGKPQYYYNTLIVFSFGAWYALFQNKIELLIKTDFQYIIALAGSVCIYCWTYLNRWNYGVESYTVWTAMFTVMLLMVTRKLSFKSNILMWFGDHVFSVYILQRIPMMILQRMGIAENHRYMFLIMSIVLTMVLALVFERFVEKMRSMF